MIWLSDIENNTFVFHADDIALLQAAHVMKRTDTNDQVMVECVQLQITFKVRCGQAPLVVYVEDDVYQNVTTELREEY